MTTTRPVPHDWREPAAGGAKAHPIQTLQSRMNDLFEEAWQKIGKHHMAVSGRAYTGEEPVTDLSESAKDWRLEIETPGMSEDELEVLIDEGELTIQGEKRLEREEAGRNYHLSERAYGRFSRSFGLPDDVQVKGAKASYQNGVLTVTIPKKPGAKPAAKRIPISSK